MSISVFDLFSIGIGPSSSHTVGPMRAAGRFLSSLARSGTLDDATRLRVELFGSLGLTGKGHGCAKALVLGLLGEHPEKVAPDRIPALLEGVAQAGAITIGGSRELAFDAEKDLVFHRRERLPLHPNGLRFLAYGADEDELWRREYYSVGGGFIVGADADEAEPLYVRDPKVPHPFTTGRELLERAEETGKCISTLVLENELTWRTEADLRAGLLELWQVMQESVERGCQSEGILPGGSRSSAGRRPCVESSSGTPGESGTRWPFSTG